MIYRVYTLTDDGLRWQFNSESDTTLAAILAKKWSAPIQIEHTDDETGVTTIDVSQSNGLSD